MPQILHRGLHEQTLLSLQPEPMTAKSFQDFCQGCQVLFFSWTSDDDIIEIAQDMRYPIKSSIHGALEDSWGRRHPNGNRV